MTQLTLLPIRELGTLSTEDLRAELARGLTLTADVLTRLGMVWAELERRGEDLSDLRTGIARNLPLIAAGRLAAESVVAFAGRPAVLRAMEGLPLGEQRALAAGRLIPVIDPADPATVVDQPLAALPTPIVRLVLSDGEIREPAAQRLAVRHRRRHARPTEPTYRYTPRYDREAGTITVGRMTIRLSDLLGALAAAVGPDHPLADDPREYVACKVRLTRPEMDRLLAEAKRTGLPEWELARKALRAFGLI